jgi:hypothetical protein
VRSEEAVIGAKVMVADSVGDSGWRSENTIIKAHRRISPNIVKIS